MTETMEQKAQRVFETRGYLVISSLDPCAIGEVIRAVDWGNHPSKDIKPCAVVVIGETDEADHIEQARCAGLTRWRNERERPRYYRVVAE